MFDLSGQNALVTGASSGLGLSIAKGLAACGAHVVLNSRSEDNAGRAAEEVGREASALAFDATDAEAVSEAMKRLEAERPLSILVNNAGLRCRKSLYEYELEDVDRLLRGNVTAPFHVAREASRGMCERGYGRIVNITSITGPMARAIDQAYGASKSGLEAMTRSLAAALGKKGVNVNAVAPGFFHTAPNDALTKDPAVKAWVDGRMALGRWGQPDEIKGGVVFLCSREASYVTGQTLFIDGGMNGHY